MSEQTTPSTSIAESYVKEELASARKSLKNTQIFGSILVIILGLYVVIVSVKFANFFKPESAAGIATGFAVGLIDKYHDSFVNGVQERVPAVMQEAPDYVLKQMPIARSRVGQNFEESLRKYGQATNDKLTAQIDQYFKDNKDSIKAVLDASNDPNAMAKLGPAIRTQLVAAYLNQAPAEGKSVDEQVTDSLTMLQNAEQRMHRLATATDLTPAEQKTKRAVAIIMETVNKEYLMPISLPLEVKVPQP